MMIPAKLDCYRQSTKRLSYAPNATWARVLVLGAMATILSPMFALQSLSDDPRSVPDASSVQEDAGQLASFRAEIVEGKYVEAAPRLRTYLEGHPLSWQAHYELGYVLFRTHDVKASVAELSRSLELNINNAEAHKILGLDLTIVEEENLAGVEFLQAVRLEPKSAEIHYFLGRHYMTQSAFRNAQRELEAAIALDPEYVKAYDNLGLTMESLNDKAAALRNYNQAIALAEKQSLHSEWPYLDLARFYRSQHEPDLALTYARKAVDKNPRADQAYFEFAKIYRDCEEWELSVQFLHKAIAIDPHSGEYYYVLGQVDRKLGRMDESREALKKSAELHDQAGCSPAQGALTVPSSSDPHP